MISAWPQEQLTFDSKLAQHFDVISGLISYINNIRTEYKLEVKNKITLFLDEKAVNIISKEKEFIQKRAGVDEIKFGEPKEKYLKRTMPGFNIYVPLGNLINTEKEKDRLEKGIVNLEKIIAGFKSRLKNKDFVSKAPKQITDQQKETLAKKEAELQELKKHLSSLK